MANWIFSMPYVVRMLEHVEDVNSALPTVNSAQKELPLVPVPPRDTE